MNDIDEADVIKNLLDRNPENREKALAILREHWDIRFREYLWKAIEIEDDPKLQLQMVELAFNKLGEKCLRKMIRFVEQKKLHPSSFSFFLRQYVFYENSEIRVALIKSLQRVPSYTHVFVAKLLRSKQLVKRDKNYVQSFLSDIFSSSIPSNSRIEMFSCLIAQLLDDYEYRVQVEPIWDIIREETLLQQTLLNIMLHKISQLSCGRFHNKIRLFWERWNTNPALISNPEWDVQVSDYIVSRLHLNEFDEFILNSVLSRDQVVRSLVISVLGEQRIKQPLEEILNISGLDHEAYLDNLYRIWDDLIAEGVDQEFLKLHSFDEESLLGFFEHCQRPILEQMRMARVGVELAVPIMLFLPRKLLIDLADNDPVVENRRKAFQILKHELFWENKHLIGPYSTWRRMFELMVRALRFEDDEELKIIVLELMFQLLNVLELHENDFSIHIKENIAELSERVKIIENPLFRDMTNLIFNYFVHQDIGELGDYAIPLRILKIVLPIIFQKQIIPEMIIKVFDNSDYDTKAYVLNELKRKLETTTEEAQIDAINTILTHITKDKDVRIRTNALLLLRKN